MKPANVLWLWWELTKLVLAGKGRYECGVVLSSVDRTGGSAFERDDPVVGKTRRANWYPTYVDWHGGDDRFAVIMAEPDDPEYFRPRGYRSTIGTPP